MDQAFALFVIGRALLVSAQSIHA
ncbi:protein of unknown function [Methylorubrum extorquens]|uniref:Uncharacterized protein n=1 Tax=Methylorubrum extorquens TaxID=408 RepID=A0A2N9AW82_METEX|nr:protein of unknown function [Methylorubrum extorquens]